MTSIQGCNGQCWTGFSKDGLWGQRLNPVAVLTPMAGVLDTLAENGSDFAEEEIGCLQIPTFMLTS